MPYEVERKFRVADVEAVLASLQAAGAARQGVSLQEDTYFRHPCRDFGATDEALRVRVEAGRGVLTYKGPKIDTTTKTRRELEVELPSRGRSRGSQGVDQMTELLLALGFQPVIRIRKQRTHFRLPHAGIDFSLGLDEVEGLGVYLETETVVEAEALERALQAMAALVAQLGLSQEERRSYLELLLPNHGAA